MIIINKNKNNRRFDFPSTRTFESRWEEAICDAAIYLRSALFSPDEVYHHDVPMTMIKDIEEAYYRNNYSDEEFSKENITSCVGYIWEKHMWFFTNYLGEFRKHFGSNNCEVVEFMLVTIFKAVEIIDEDIDEKKVYYQYKYDEYDVKYDVKHRKENK